MRFLLPWGPMLTKNICKKSPPNLIFFSKIQKSLSVWPRGSNNQNLKEIRALGSEIIATQTTDIGRQTNFDFLSSADIVIFKQVKQR